VDAELSCKVKTAKTLFESIYVTYAQITRDSRHSQSSSVSRRAFISFIFAGLISTGCKSPNYVIASETPLYTPTVPSTSTITRIGAGRDHSLVLAGDGSISGWGANFYGQLGDKTNHDQNVPVHLSKLLAASAVSGGEYHTLAIVDGLVYGWGANDYSQLGSATQQQFNTPIQIPNLTGIGAVAGGHIHSLALTQDGAVWGWGNNSYGQLGNGQLSNTGTGMVDQIIPVKAEHLSDFLQIAAGGVHSVSLDTNGTVWTWGANNYGQLGDGTTTTNALPSPAFDKVIQIDAGNDHTIALKDDGTVWAWGHNPDGQLGIPNSTLQRKIPTAVAQLNNIVGIAAGGRHNLALDNTGLIWSWGFNSYGQLGDGSTVSRSIPSQVLNLRQIVAIAAGNNHSLALRDDGTVWAWGQNEHGQLGTGDTSNQTLPVQVKGLGPAPTIVPQAS
jgi:alpha-tubulin suppressor-like RCC1 family protein